MLKESTEFLIILRGNPSFHALTLQLRFQAILPFYRVNITEREYILSEKRTGKVVLHFKILTILFPFT